MKDFDSIKDLWQQQTPADKTLSEAAAISKLPAAAKTKLLRHLAIGAVTLTATAVFISWVGFFSGIHFTSSLTYIALLLVIAVILAQVAIIRYTYQKLKKIDDTLAPAAHLQQWEAYYLFREKQVQWNIPLYFIFLNLAMGLYFIEIFSGRKIFWVIVFIAVYIAWMLFACFVLGKRARAKEVKKLKSIIDNLKLLEGQLKSEG